MSKLLKILLVIIIAGAAGGFIYWQYNKKKILRDSITNAIAKKTDSLYYIHYDSSSIDELNGNAVFYNVVLQSDSAQKQLLNSTDSLPNALYNIRIQQVMARGVDIPGLLQQQTVAAGSIVLLKPVIQIINTGSDIPKPFTISDTLELYQKILGKFKSIRADTIRITNGTLLITNKSGKAQTTFENINITLNKFLVDSTKNYESIISYFIKDVRATIDNIQLPASKNDTRINLEKVDYNATQRYLHIKSIKQYQLNNMQPVIDLGNVQVNDLNTDAFIIQQRLKAGQITCDGGLVTIYVKKKKDGSKTGDQEIELSTEMIDQAQVAGINLGKTKLVIKSKDEPGKTPFILNNATFRVTKMLKINEGTTIANLVNNAEWELAADAFSLVTKNKLYKITFGNFVVNSAAAAVKISSFSLKPQVTEQQFVSQSSFQQDLYNLVINNISLSGVNIKKLVANKEIEIEKASFQPIIKIYNDRTLPSENKSKVGNYPHQSILKLPVPIFIKVAEIINGQVSYRERAVKSKQVGNVYFNNINATINNITNIPTRIQQNSTMKLNAAARFLGTGSISTEWQFPLNAANGAFNIKGRLGNMEAANINPIIEPLAMAAIKQGRIDEVTFNLAGTDAKAVGNVLFLYHNLKMEMLKAGEGDSLKKKGLVSLLANTLIKNENTSSSNSKEVNYDRDITRSFFNLVWKSIFTGAKKTVLGKKEKEETK